MNVDEIAVGMVARYPRTGTTGRVERIEEIDGIAFAGLDATDLFYRVDHLIPVSHVEKRRKSRKEGYKKVLEKEREAATSIEEEWRPTDELCEGGG